MMHDTNFDTQAFSQVKKGVQSDVIDTSVSLEWVFEFCFDIQVTIDFFEMKQTKEMRQYKMDLKISKTKFVPTTQVSARPNSLRMKQLIQQKR